MENNPVTPVIIQCPSNGAESNVRTCLSFGKTCRYQNKPLYHDSCCHSERSFLLQSTTYLPKAPPWSCSPQLTCCPTEQPSPTPSPLTYPRLAAAAISTWWKKNLVETSRKVKTGHHLFFSRIMI